MYLLSFIYIYSISETHRNTKAAALTVSPLTKAVHDELKKEVPLEQAMCTHIPEVPQQDTQMSGR